MKPVWLNRLSRKVGEGLERWHQLKGIGAKWSIPSCSSLIGCHHRMRGTIFFALARLRGPLTSRLRVQIAAFFSHFTSFSRNTWHQKKSCWNEAKITVTLVAEEHSGPPFAIRTSEVTGLEAFKGGTGGCNDKQQYSTLCDPATAAGLVQFALHQSGVMEVVGLCSTVSTPTLTPSSSLSAHPHRWLRCYMMLEDPELSAHAGFTTANNKTR